MKKRYLIACTGLILLILLKIPISCSKEKQTLRDFCGQKILLKDSSGGEIVLHFQGIAGSENTLQVSSQFNFYHTNDSIRCDTLLK